MSKLTDELAEHLRMHNSWEFAKAGGSRIWIDYGHYHAHAQGYTDPRSKVMARDDVRRYVEEKVFRPDNRSVHWTKQKEEVRDTAIAYVAEKYGYAGEWKRTPYNDAWVPAEVYRRVLEKLKAAKASATESA